MVATLLEAARWMAHNRPHEVGEACWYCNGGWPADFSAEDPPKVSCPWLALPRIVAALEAAERLAEVFGSRPPRFKAMTDQDASEADALRALVAALRGEV